MSAWTTVARSSAVAMLGALLVQFLLGIWVNLYVPKSSIMGGGRQPGGMMGSSQTGIMGGMSRAMSGATPVMLHMMLGWLLLLAALGALIGAVVGRHKAAMITAVAGVLSVAIAGIGGLEFASSGHDAYSFLMAVGFTGAVGSYGAELYLLR